MGYGDFTPLSSSAGASASSPHPPSQHSVLDSKLEFLPCCSDHLEAAGPGAESLLIRPSDLILLCYWPYWTASSVAVDDPRRRHLDQLCARRLGSTSRLWIPTADTGLTNAISHSSLGTRLLTGEPRRPGNLVTRSQAPPGQLPAPFRKSPSTASCCRNSYRFPMSKVQHSTFRSYKTSIHCPSLGRSRVVATEDWKRRKSPSHRQENWR